MLNSFGKWVGTKSHSGSWSLEPRGSDLAYICHRPPPPSDSRILDQKTLRDEVLRCRKNLVVGRLRKSRLWRTRMIVGRFLQTQASPTFSRGILLFPRRMMKLVRPMESCTSRASGRCPRINQNTILGQRFGWYIFANPPTYYNGGLWFRGITFPSHTPCLGKVWGSIPHDSILFACLGVVVGV